MAAATLPGHDTCRPPVCIAAKMVYCRDVTAGGPAVNFLGRAATFACHSLRRIRREETHDIVPSAGSPPGSRRLLQPRECAMTSRLPRLLGAFPDAMVIVDAQGRIRQANARAASLFGCGQRQLNGMPIQDLFPGRPARSDGWWSRRRNQAEHYLELVGSRGDSRRFRAAVIVMPIDTKDDAAAVITIRDLTETQETQFILERGLEMLSAVISSR
jgi:PAS domain S-box-containing protein